MTKPRTEHWKDGVYIPTMFSGEDEEAMERLSSESSVPPDSLVSGEGLTTTDIIRSCKELIFDNSGDSLKFHCVTYQIDCKYIAIKFDLSLEISFNDDDLENEVLQIFAIATAFEVPVFPNLPSDLPELTRLHRKMLQEGFTMKNEQGLQSHLVLTRKEGALLLKNDFDKTLDFTIQYPPAELEIIRQRFLEEISRRDNAEKIFATLNNAINQLEQLLKIETSIENQLQICLTHNPILFGPQYDKIIPKHRLGAEYEMDYALRTVSGTFHLIEIEASNHELFTKKGQPRSQLIHAEQQVLDWLSWIERHNSYAREGLASLENPMGFVVIGRTKNLNEEAQRKLRQRNSMFRGKLQILTYDELLEQAKLLLRRLTGEN